MKPQYVASIHEPGIRELVESAAVPRVPAERKRAPETLDYARRYFAEKDAHALTLAENASLIDHLRREEETAEGLRTQCYVLGLSLLALFGGVLLLAGRIWK